MREPLRIWRELCLIVAFGDLSASAGGMGKSHFLIGPMM